MRKRKRKKKIKKEKLFFIFLLTIFAFFAFYNLKYKNYCFFDFECDWKITNCCPEEAGAKWECVNLKSFEKPKCEGLILCPQIISPRPEKNCVCLNGKCVAK